MWTLRVTHLLMKKNTAYMLKTKYNRTKKKQEKKDYICLYYNFTGSNLKNYKFCLEQ